MERDSPSQPAISSEFRLRTAAAFLSQWQRSLRHIGYRQAEDLCAELAVSLCDELGSEGLEAAELQAIPRGGFVVLALLAYHLDSAEWKAPSSRSAEPTQPEQTNPEPPSPLVLVDDCALSGLRLRQALAEVPEDRPVVVVHLLSTPELRAAVLAQAPQVRACFAARDLTDHSHQIYPDPEEHAAWLRRSEERLGAEDRFWIGLPEPVSFAWAEPDRPFWNPTTGKLEDCWRFQAPHRCLKSRARLASDLPAAAEGPGGGGLWRSPASVVWGEFEGRVWLVRQSDQEIFSLDGAAAVIWKTLVIGRNEARAADALVQLFAVSSPQATADVAALACDLREAQLLEAVEPDGE